MIHRPLIQDVFTVKLDEHRRCVEACEGCTHIMVELARLRRQKA